MAKLTAFQIFLIVQRVNNKKANNNKKVNNNKSFGDKHVV